MSKLVIGAAIEVHRHLGPGFLESVYEDALCVELGLRGIGYERQVPVAIEYKGRLLARVRLDLIVEDRVVVELKSVEELLPLHLAQLRAYLAATENSLGLLINFNVPVLREGVRRVLR